MQVSPCNVADDLDEDFMKCGFCGQQSGTGVSLSAETEEEYGLFEAKCEPRNFFVGGCCAHGLTATELLDKIKRLPDLPEVKKWRLQPDKQAILLLCLQSFSCRYVPNVKVQLADIKPRGYADLEKREICLSPIQSLEQHGFSAGGGAWYDYRETWERLKLKQGEQYFLTLLHEIGHFKKKLRPPTEYLRAKKRLMKAYPNNLEAQIYNAGQFIRIPNRQDRAQGKIADFESWLAGEWIREHILVDKWAFEEFRRRRKSIRDSLTERGFWD
jgi:hypothetical protein